MKNKYRILVIEDEKNIRMFLAAILEANDYQVLFAQNGESAYSQIFSFCPDLILLDLGLPDMDGQRIIRDAGPPFRSWSFPRAVRSKTKLPRWILAQTTISPSRFPRANWTRAYAPRCV